MWGLKPRMAFRFERDGADDSLRDRRSRSQSAKLGSWAKDTQEMAPSVSMPRCPGCDLS